MRRRTWTPGGYPAAVTERGIFVLEPGHEALAQRFWELMVDGADLPVLLQELTSAFAANLASLPSFVAIIDEAGGAHIAVRGAFEVVVDGPEGPTSVAGGNVITWSEYRFRAHSGWRIATPVDGLAPEETPWQALSAVLPVSTLASGTVGEVRSAGASPIVSRVESEARPGLDEAAVPVPSATPIDEAAVPVPSAAPIDEAGPATSEPVHSPETEEDAQPLALASSASSQGEPADEALMVTIPPPRPSSRRLRPPSSRRSPLALTRPPPSRTTNLTNPTIPRRRPATTGTRPQPRRRVRPRARGRKHKSPGTIARKKRRNPRQVTTASPPVTRNRTPNPTRNRHYPPPSTRNRGTRPGSRAARIVSPPTSTSTTT